MSSSGQAPNVSMDELLASIKSMIEGESSGGVSPDEQEPVNNQAGDAFDDGIMDLTQVATPPPSRSLSKEPSHQDPSPALDPALVHNPLAGLDQDSKAQPYPADPPVGGSAGGAPQAGSPQGGAHEAAAQINDILNGLGAEPPVPEKAPSPEGRPQSAGHQMPRGPLPGAEAAYEGRAHPPVQQGQPPLARGMGPGGDDPRRDDIYAGAVSLAPDSGPMGAAHPPVKADEVDLDGFDLAFSEKGEAAAAVQAGHAEHAMKRELPRDADPVRGGAEDPFGFDAANGKPGEHSGLGGVAQGLPHERIAGAAVHGGAMGAGQAGHAPMPHGGHPGGHPGHGGQPMQGGHPGYGVPATQLPGPQGQVGGDLRSESELAMGQALRQADASLGLQPSLQGQPQGGAPMGRSWQPQGQQQPPGYGGYDLPVPAAGRAMVPASQGMMVADPSADQLPVEMRNNLEEIVKQLLKPLLREWLERNLPELLRGAVDEQGKIDPDRL